jgi:hypothetical protein
MRSVRAFLVIIVLISTLAFAQSSSNTGEAAASKDDVEALFTTMHIREQMGKMMSAMMAQMKEITHENVRKRRPNITQEELAHIDAMADSAVKAYNLDDVFNDMIPIYQRHQSKPDVAAILAFYQSPTGQKLLREQPAMIAESMEVSRVRMEKVMGELMDKIEGMAREDGGRGTKE